MASYSFDDLSVGIRCSRSYEFTSERVQLFATLVDDPAPVHVDREFAREQGFEDRIVHGLFVQSVISGMLGTEVPGPRSVINNLTMKMHRPVSLGQTVSYETEIIALTNAVRAVSLTFLATVDGVVVMSGKALCSFPSPAGR